jgi:hypothetical protein
MPATRQYSILPSLSSSIKLKLNLLGFRFSRLSLWIALSFGRRVVVQPNYAIIISQNIALFCLWNLHLHMQDKIQFSYCKIVDISQYYLCETWSGFLCHLWHFPARIYCYTCMASHFIRSWRILRSNCRPGYIRESLVVFLSRRCHNG